MAEVAQVPIAAVILGHVQRGLAERLAKRENRHVRRQEATKDGRLNFVLERQVGLVELKEVCDVGPLLARTAEVGLRKGGQHGNEQTAAVGPDLSIEPDQDFCGPADITSHPLRMAAGVGSLLEALQEAAVTGTQGLNQRVHAESA